MGTSARSAPSSAVVAHVAWTREEKYAVTNGHKLVWAKLLEAYVVHCEEKAVRFQRV